MTTRILVLVLLLCAHGQIFGEDKFNKSHKPLDDVFEKVRQAQHAGRGTEAADLLLEFITENPTHEQIPMALETLRTQSLVTQDPDGKLRKALRALTAQGDESPAHALAINWINANARLLPWEFGKVPQLMRASKDAEITVSLGRVYNERKYPPTYRLYLIPPGEIKAGIESTGYGEAIITNAARVPREHWQPVDSRTEMYDPEPEKPETIFGSRRSEFGETVDFLHADLSSGGVFAIEQTIDGFTARSFFHAPRFGMFCKPMGKTTFVYAADVWTGKPIANLQIEVKTEDTSFRRETNDEGYASFAAPEYSHVVASLGNDVQSCGATWEDIASPGDMVIITTDRPIYRPKQTVRFKAVIRSDQHGSIALPKVDKILKVEIRGPLGRLIQTQNLSLNAFGSLSGSFELADEPALGEYRIVVPVERPLSFEQKEWVDYEWERNWSQTFEVAAYRKPEMEVTVLPSGESKPGEKIRATVNARYYFGGPVKNGDVQWRVVTKPTYGFHDTQQRKPFEDPRAWFYESQPIIGEFDPSDGGFGMGFGFGPWNDNLQEEVASGTGTTDEEGNMEIVFDADTSGASMTYTVSATVRDRTRMTAEGSAEIQAHESPWQITVGTPRNFYKPGEEIHAQVRLKTHDGEPVSDQAIKLSAFMQVESGILSENEFESFSIDEVKTDAKGLATLNLVAPEDGRLRLRAATLSKENANVVGRADIWIAGEKAVTQNEYFGPLTGNFGGEFNEPMVEIETDQLAYAAGENIRIMVRSSRVPVHAMLMIEGHDVALAKSLLLTKRCEVIEIPLPKKIPNRARIHLLSWLGGKFAVDNTDIAILPADKILKVAIETGNSHYAPGEKANVSLVVKDAQGIPAASEVELGIVDESLLSLAEDQSADIRSFFFPSPDFYNSGNYSHVSVPEDMIFADDTFANIADGTYGGGGGFGFGGGGFGGFGGGGFGGGGGGLGGGGGGFFGGGGDPFGGGGGGNLGGEAGPGLTGGPSAPLAGTGIRKKFADTFYWSGHVQTGKDGKAQLELDVPDTLSQWRIVARAVSGQDKFGYEKSSVVTRKDVIVRLSAPRFFTDGDKAVVSSVVSNNTQEDAEFQISLHCEGATGGGMQTRTVSAGGQARVDWQLEIDTAGLVKLQTKALSTIASDAMELNLPVRPYGIEKRIAKNGRLDKGIWATKIEIPKDADLKTCSIKIVVNDAGTAAIREALPYLADYPYGCVEQTMSRFLPAVVASGAMKRRNIANDGLADELPAMVHQGLQRLYNFQHDDGGWGWWKDDETNEFMTTYVLYGLLTAKEAGYEIDPETLERGIELLRGFDPQPFTVRVLRLAGIEFRFDLEDVIIENETDKPVREGVTPDPFAPDVPAPDAPEDLDNPFGDVGDGDGRALFVAARARRVARSRNYTIEEVSWLVLGGYHELAEQLPTEPPATSGPDEVRETSLLIRALLAADPKDNRIEPLVDWLMQQRRGGAWYSTLDTAYAVFALSELPTPAAEQKVEVTINGKSIEAKSGSLLIPAEDLRHGETPVQIKSTADQTMYASVLLTYFSTDLDQPSDGSSPLVVQRTFERLATVDGKQFWEAVPSGGKIAINDELRVMTTVNGTENVERVMIESPIAAGTEVKDEESGDNVDVFSSWYARREARDDRVAVAVGEIAEDEQSFEFSLRPTSPGTYRILPAIAFPMYDPDKQAHSTVFVIEVVDE